MQKKPELVVMLTYQDVTVKNARAVFEQCRDSKAKIWGFKEKPLPLKEMQALCAEMKQCGIETALEVVAYTEQEGLAGAETAVACGVDYLMGTKYFDSIHALCREHGLRYLPFVGTVTGRPSVLEGTVSGMVAEARSYLEKGVFGIDLLGYRYTGDGAALNRAFVELVDAPVCIAGSVDSYQRLDELCEAAPWSFTIGSAFFDGRFGGTMREQIDRVCDYMEEKA